MPKCSFEGLKMQVGPQWIFCVVESLQEVGQGTKRRDFKMMNAKLGMDAQYPEGGEHEL